MSSLDFLYKNSNIRLVPSFVPFLDTALHLIPRHLWCESVRRAPWTSLRPESHAATRILLMVDHRHLCLSQGVIGSGTHRSCFLSHRRVQNFLRGAVSQIICFFVYYLQSRPAVFPSTHCNCQLLLRILLPGSSPDIASG